MITSQIQVCTSAWLLSWHHRDEPQANRRRNDKITAASFGWVQVDDDVCYAPYAGETVTALEMFRDFGVKLDAAAIRRYLAAPIDVRSRAYLQKELVNG